MTFTSLRKNLKFFFYEAKLRNNFSTMIFIAFCLCIVSSCSWNKYDGVYVGTLTSETKRLGIDKSVLDTTNDDEQNIVVMVKQNGAEVFVSINNSRPFGNCNLRAKINKKNGTAYIDDPQPCGAALSLTGSLTVDGNELILNLGGFTQYSDQSFRFRGSKK